MKKVYMISVAGDTLDIGFGQGHIGKAQEVLRGHLESVGYGDFYLEENIYQLGYDDLSLEVHTKERAIEIATKLNTVLPESEDNGETDWNAVVYEVAKDSQGDIDIAEDAEWIWG